MADDNDGCLILIVLFFMALRGCSHAEENEGKIEKLEQQIQSVSEDNDKLETEIDRMKNR
jgi:peptidoglycan hydrolase CwlO-like protein